MDLDQDRSNQMILDLMILDSMEINNNVAVAEKIEELEIKTFLLSVDSDDYLFIYLTFNIDLCY